MEIVAGHMSPQVKLSPNAFNKLEAPNETAITHRRVDGRVSHARRGEK